MGTRSRRWLLGITFKGAPAGVEHPGESRTSTDITPPTLSARY